MSSPRSVAFWVRVSGLLAEHERAQAAAIQVEVEKAWESLRQKLQTLALEDEMQEADEGGEP